jgi:hypothetical protein
VRSDEGAERYEVATAVVWVMNVDSAGEVERGHGKDIRARDHPC